MSIANVERHVVHGVAECQHVARQRFGDGRHLDAHGCLMTAPLRHFNANLFVGVLDETGTIKPVVLVGTTPQVGDAEVFLGRIDHRLSSGRSTIHQRAASGPLRVGSAGNRTGASVVNGWCA